MTVKIKIRKGPISVNGATILASGDNIVAISIDLKQKWACLDCIGYDEKSIPSIFLIGDDRTIGVAKSKNELTEIKLPEYENWDVFSCTVNRYSASICLIKY